jgi:hypothetical protein
VATSASVAWRVGTPILRGDRGDVRVGGVR